MPQELYIRTERYNAVTPLHAGREACAPGHAYGPAVRTHWLLHYVLSGTGRYEVGGKTFVLHAGEAFLIKPGEVTRYEADKNDPWEYEWFGFASTLKKLSALPYVIASAPLTHAVRDADALFGQGGDVRAISAMWRVIGALCDTLEEDDDTYTARAIDQIRQQYMRPLTVKDLADAQGLDRSYFSHVFKRDTGQSPGQYLLAFRMEKALELLARGQYAVSVVAASVGYGDVFGFSRSFKKYFGTSPREYMRVIAEKK